MGSFPWLVVACSRSWACIFGYPKLPLPGMWADVGSGFRLTITLYVGLVLVCLSSARCVGLVCLIGMPVGFCSELFPIFLCL